MLVQSDAEMDTTLKEELQQRLESVHTEEILSIREDRRTWNISAEFDVYSKNQDWVFGDLGLPWLRGNRGKLTGGPHGNSGKRPYSSLDFQPPQGIIRAPASGAITFGCNRVRIRIDHGNGYRSGLINA